MKVKWQNKEIELCCSVEEARALAGQLITVCIWADIVPDDASSTIAKLYMFLHECEPIGGDK